MRIIFCNVAYLKYYDNRVDGELTPKTGGSFVKEEGDAHEKWNFLNIDGYCYGYVQGKVDGDHMHIENLENVSRQSDLAENVTVIWCASHETRGTVVVGWYENATVYRYLEEMKFLFLEEYRGYWFKVKAEDAYLLPENLRTFKVGRASQEGKGRGFGQQNYWFAKSDYAREELIPNLMKMIESNRKNRINLQLNAFDEPTDLSPLSEAEEKQLLSLYDRLKDEDKTRYNDLNRKILMYEYRKFYNDKTSKNAYKIAYTLELLFQYKLSISWHEKTLELEEYNFNSLFALGGMYKYLGDFDKANFNLEKLLNHPDVDDELRDILYYEISENHYLLGDDRKAVEWIDKILNESKHQETIEDAKMLKESLFSKSM